MRLSRIRVAIIGVTLAASGVFAAVAIKKRLSSPATPELVVAAPNGSVDTVASATPGAAAETSTGTSTGASNLATPKGETAMAAAEPAAPTRADRPFPYVLGTELVEYDRVVVTGQQHPAAKPFTKRTAVKETIAVVALAKSEPALNPQKSAPAIPALIATVPESATAVEPGTTSEQTVEAEVAAASGRANVKTAAVKNKPVVAKADESSLSKAKGPKVKSGKPAEKAAAKPPKAGPKNAAKPVNKAVPGKAATKSAVAKPKA